MSMNQKINVYVYAEHCTQAGQVVPDEKIDSESDDHVLMYEQQSPEDICADAALQLCKTDNQWLKKSYTDILNYLEA